MNKCTIPNREFVSYLKKLAKKLGRTPGLRDFNTDPDKPDCCAMTVAKRFGSWNSALSAAGLKPNRVRKPKKTKEELISEIKALAEKLGRTPLVREFADYSGLGRDSIVIRRHGGWGNLVESAKLKYRHRRISRSNEELISQVKKLARKLKRAPRVWEFNKSIGAEEYSDIIKKRFGSWQKFLAAAGLLNRCNEKVLIVHLKDMAAELGRTPTEREFNDAPHTASYRTVLRKFGSWELFLKAAKLA